MLVLTAALLAGLVAGYAAGGRLRNIEHLHIRLPWLAVVALLLQFLAFSPARGPLGDAGVVALHVVSYVLLLWFVVANRRRLGVLVAGAGMLLNMLAITLNGGYMPATGWALRVAGQGFSGTTHNNSTATDSGTRLWFLGDVFAVPRRVPLANVFSIGDVLIVVGVALLIAAAMRARPAPVADSR